MGKRVLEVTGGLLSAPPLRALLLFSFLSLVTLCVVPRARAVHRVSYIRFGRHKGLLAFLAINWVHVWVKRLTFNRLKRFISFVSLLTEFSELGTKINSVVYKSFAYTCIYSCSRFAYEITSTEILFPPQNKLSKCCWCYVWNWTKIFCPCKVKAPCSSCRESSNRFTEGFSDSLELLHFFCI